MRELVYVEHTFEPIYDKNSKILILGSFPFVKSREKQFYYGHPQNRFWKVIAAITGECEPFTIERPANADFVLERLCEVWRKEIETYLYQ